MEKIALKNNKIIFLTGDLGFMALENIRSAIGKRFVNMGVCEQNMINVAAGLASQGLLPVCYSIASFIVFRPVEQIRLNLCLHNMNVKIVGNGGGYGYGIMGATHHAIEDIAVLSCMQNMRCFIPFCNEDVESTVEAMFEYAGPCYLRLGYGTIPETFRLPKYAKTRRLICGNKITIVGAGPVILEILKALESLKFKHCPVELFVISEIPVVELDKRLELSIMKTQKLLIVEEHVKRGGLGENLAALILQKGIKCRLTHLHACGYPDGLYGSQKYHYEKNNLNNEKIFVKIQELING